MSECTSYLASHIISGDDMQVVKNTSLNVVDGKILSIAQPPDDAKQVDLENSLISPLFINAHCHLGDTGAKELGIGLPLEQVVVPPDGLKHRFLASLDHQTHLEQMRHGLKEMLQNGIIACADFREQGLAGVQLLQQAKQDLPIRVITLGRMSEMTTQEIAYQEAQEILSIADGLGIRDMNAYPLPLLLQLRDEFPDKLFAMHVSENYESEMISRNKFGIGQTVRALEIRPDILVHLTHTPENELELVARDHIHAVTCPRANSILGDGLPDIVSWSKAKLEFALGSDNMMIAAPDMFREMDYLSRMLRGLFRDSAIIDFKQIFKAATIQGARALKLDRDLGSLAPGKEASFMVVNLESENLTFCQDLLSAMVHRTNLTDIRNIYIKGELFK